MTGRRKSTSPVQCLVDRARVVVRELDVFLVCGLQPDRWHQGEQNLRLRLGQHLGVTVPASTLQVKAVNVRSIFRSDFLVKIALRAKHFEVKIDLVDGDHISTGEILLDAGQERLGEEEP